MTSFSLNSVDSAIKKFEAEIRNALVGVVSDVPPTNTFSHTITRPLTIEFRIPDFEPTLSTTGSMNLFNNYVSGVFREQLGLPGNDVVQERYTLYKKIEELQDKLFPDVEILLTRRDLSIITQFLTNLSRFTTDKIELYTSFNKDLNQVRNVQALDAKTCPTLFMERSKKDQFRLGYNPKFLFTAIFTDYCQRFIGYGNFEKANALSTISYVIGHELLHYRLGHSEPGAMIAILEGINPQGDLISNKQYHRYLQSLIVQFEEYTINQTMNNLLDRGVSSVAMGDPHTNKVLSVALYTPQRTGDDVKGSFNLIWEDTFTPIANDQSPEFVKFPIGSLNMHTAQQIMLLLYEQVRQESDKEKVEELRDKLQQMQQDTGMGDDSSKENDPQHNEEPSDSDSSANPPPSGNPFPPEEPPSEQGREVPDGGSDSESPGTDSPDLDSPSSPGSEDPDQTPSEDPNNQGDEQPSASNVDTASDGRDSAPSKQASKPPEKWKDVAKPLGGSKASEKALDDVLEKIKASGTLEKAKDEILGGGDEPDSFDLGGRNQGLGSSTLPLAGNLLKELSTNKNFFRNILRWVAAISNKEEDIDTWNPNLPSRRVQGLLGKSTEVSVKRHSSLLIILDTSPSMTPYYDTIKIVLKTLVGILRRKDIVRDFMLLDLDGHGTMRPLPSRQISLAVDKILNNTVSGSSLVPAYRRLNKLLDQYPLFDITGIVYISDFEFFGEGGRVTLTDSKLQRFKRLSKFRKIPNLILYPGNTISASDLGMYMRYQKEHAIFSFIDLETGEFYRKNKIFLSPQELI